jgi:hypothetical protein
MNFYSNERRLGKNEVNEEDLKAMCFYLKRPEYISILFLCEYARKIITEPKMVTPVAAVDGNGAARQPARYRVLAIIYRARYIFIQFFFGRRYNIIDYAVSSIGRGADHQQVPQ